MDPGRQDGFYDGEDPLGNWNGEGEYPMPTDGTDDDGAVGSDSGSDSGSLRETADKVRDAVDRVRKPETDPNQRGGPHESKTGNARPHGPGETPSAGAKGATELAEKGAKASQGAKEGAALAKTGATAVKGGAVAAEGAAGPVGWAVLAASLAADPKFRKSIQKAVIVIMLVLLAVVSLFLAGTTNQHVNTKEITAESNGRIGFNSIQTRASILRNEALFTDPNSCSDEPVYCLLTPGISQSEIDRMRRQDLVIEDSDIQGSDDKFYLNQLRYRKTPVGTIIAVNSSTFPEKYREDADLFEKMERVTSSGSIFFRSPLSVQRFQLYGASRNNPYDEEEQDTEKLVDTFRKVVYGASGQTQSLGYGLDAPISARVSDIQASIKSTPATSAANIDLTSPGIGAFTPPSGYEPAPGVPATTIANTVPFGVEGSDDKIQAEIDADETKAAVVEIYDGLSSQEQVCAFAFGLDALNFNNKVAKSRALARYGTHFMSMADANKLGVVTSQHVSLINGIQNDKSTAEGSFGLTFSQSEGFLLVSQGLVNARIAPDPASSNPDEIILRGTGGAARVTTGGNPSLLYLNQIVGNLNTATPVESVTSSPLYTSEDLKAAYDSTDPCGTLYAATGDPSGDQLQKMRLLMGQYMTPQFLLNKAGTIAPDPRSDPEEGYGSGNNVAAGVGALVSGIGRNIGLEAIRQEDMQTFLTEANATSFYPGYIDTAGNGKDNYRNNLCNDRTISGEGLATDMFCNIQWGYLNSVLLDETYAPRAVINYLRTETDWPTGSACYKDALINENVKIMGPDGLNDPGVETSPACLAAIEAGLVKVEHINEDGEVKTQRYTDFMNNCIKSDKPIIDQNKWGENQYGAASAAYCATNTDDIFRFFRLFVFDGNILEAYKRSAEGTMGQTEILTTAQANSTLAESGSCPAGSKDYGMKEGWDNGQMIPIRTCGIIDWPANFANSAGEMIVEVNSTIAADSVRLAQDMKAAGLSYTASVGFRTYEQQQCLYDYYITGIKGCSMFSTRPSDAAAPGTSNHQMGMSIDIAGSQGTATGNWLDQHMSEYGFSRDVYNRNNSDYGHMTHS